MQSNLHEGSFSLVELIDGHHRDRDEGHYGDEPAQYVAPHVIVVRSQRGRPVLVHGDDENCLHQPRKSMFRLKVLLRVRVCRLARAHTHTHMRANTHTQVSTRAHTNTRTHKLTYTLALIRAHTRTGQEGKRGVEGGGGGRDKRGKGGGGARASNIPLVPLAVFFPDSALTSFTNSNRHCQWFKSLPSVRECGVPQGSVLHPIPFVLFTYPLSAIVHQYAFFASLFL